MSTELSYDGHASSHDPEPSADGSPFRWRRETRALRTMADLLPVLAARSRGRLVFPELNLSLAHRDLPARAYGIAAELRRAGVSDSPENGVGILASTSPAFVSALFGAFAANTTAVPMPAQPVGGDPAAYARQLDNLIRSSGVQCVLVGPPFEEFGDAIRARHPELTVLRIDQCDTSPRAPEGALPGPQDLAVVQFSSGSTSAPKGVMIEHGALLASIDGTADRGAVEDGDAALLWVPLFHDFGLVTLLTHLLTGSDLHMISPMSFVRRTADTIRYFAEQRIAYFTGPNFAYDRILDAAAAGLLDGLDLSGWRAAVNAGEPVASATVNRFGELLGPLGVEPAVMNPGYGAAEFCVGISYQPTDRVARIVHVDRTSLRDGHRVIVHTGQDLGTVAVVSQGPAFPGVEIRLRDGSGRVLGEGWFGEIEASGPNMFRGYLNDPAATEAAIHDGWFRTGDTGFLLDGELYVAGRRSDMIVVAGRNFHAHDVETAVRDVDGVYQRHLVAVTDVPRERMVLVVETQVDDTAALAGRIRAQVADDLGLAEVDVRLVGRGWLPRTSSGKWRRGEVRDRLQAEGDPDAGTR